MNLKLELAEVAIAIATAFTAYMAKSVSTLIVFLGIFTLITLERIKEDYDKSKSEVSEK